MEKGRLAWSNKTGGGFQKNHEFSRNRDAQFLNVFAITLPDANDLRGEHRDQNFQVGQKNRFPAFLKSGEEPSLQEADLFPGDEPISDVSLIFKSSDLHLHLGNRIARLGRRGVLKKCGSRSRRKSPTTPFYIGENLLILADLAKRRGMEGKDLQACPCPFHPGERFLSQQRRVGNPDPGENEVLFRKPSLLTRCINWRAKNIILKP